MPTSVVSQKQLAVYHYAECLHSIVVLLNHDIICFHDFASYCKSFRDFREVEQVTAYCNSML